MNEVSQVLVTWTELPPPVPPKRIDHSRKGFDHINSNMKSKSMRPPPLAEASTVSILPKMYVNDYWNQYLS